MSRVHPGQYRLKLFCWTLLGLLMFQASLAGERFAARRHAMTQEVRAMAHMTFSETGVPEFSRAVLDAMEAVPRHEFVPENMRNAAYLNQPLPIGHGQTISQPYIVALMTEMLAVDADDRVLEIGTGSGYQAAILAELVKQVYSIEIIEALALEADSRLKRLGFDNIETRLADGWHGWPEQAPFDGIIVTAASQQIPAPLIEQLRPGGRMVIPVGGGFMTQYLVLVEKTEEGEIETQQLLPVRFVPFTRNK